MLRYIEQLRTVDRIAGHLRTANEAAKIAGQHRGSYIGDYAGSLAAQELKRAMREDAKTHVGRLAR